MKKNSKRTYSMPMCCTIQINETMQLMATSFPGQHNSAEDGGTITLGNSLFEGQHESAEDGGTITLTNSLFEGQHESAEDGGTINN